MPRPIDIAKMTDREIAAAILSRDTAVTKEYLYRKCSPLFKSLFNIYYSDCDSWVELANEIYVYILLPHKVTGICKLAQFNFGCTLTQWLKVVTRNYCRQLFAKKIDIVGEVSDETDISNRIEHSLEIDVNQLDMADVTKILDLMPNQRYRTLIELRYIDHHNNEETAALMSMNMKNYYNKHKLAKAQFVATLRKEGVL